MIQENNISDETREKWKRKIEAVLESYNIGIIKLNDWEDGFINSIYGQVFGEMKDLTLSQSLKLSKIYEKVL